MGAAWIKTIFLALRTRSKCVVVFPNVHIYTPRSARISGKGLLCLGIKWKGMRYMPAEFGLGERARLIVNGRFNIRSGFHLAVSPGATLSLGSGNISDKGTIDCFEAISIGEDVRISAGVTMRDSDNHQIDGKETICAPIVIEDHVWIGMNVTILKGVTIGSGAVVAAGAVVNRDVPRNCLAGGVPAKVIRENVVWQK